MRKNFLRVGLVSLTVAGLVSCGGEPAQPLNATSTPQLMANLVSVLGQIPKSGATVPAGPTGTSITLQSKPGNVAAMAIDCETVNPTTPVDADNDHIALTKTGTFDCTDLATGSGTYSRKGTYKVTDKDDTVAGIVGGMRVDYNLTNYKTVSTDGSISNGSHVGYWDYKGDGSGGFVSTADYSGSNYNKGATDSYETDYTFKYTWNYAMKPDDPNNSWVAGSLSFKGDYSMSGKFISEDHAGTHTPVTGDWKMSYYSKNLKYDSTNCSQWFYKSGSLIIDDQNGNVMEIRYNCTSADFYVNGVKSDWYTPSSS